MPDESVWDVVERLTGHRISRIERQRGDEVSVVDWYLDSIGFGLRPGITRSNESDPPDVLSEFDGKPIAVEVARLVHGPAIEATKAFRAGKNVPGYVHPEGLDRSIQSFVWDVQRGDFDRQLRNLITKKSSDLARWSLSDENSEKWFIVEFRPCDHNREFGEIEDWASNLQCPPTAFDRVAILTCEYDPSIKLPRSTTITRCTCR